ncbi:hypothetical protein [Oceanicella sp. SM1341]|uniref:hypothetical protein n=1 Tax=Oceanicella sp. SM1341 TaxID=1548889 RepID=UPI000E54FC24|nr:hypothetical protein [Oceanicella sp. SM1341]
MLDDYSDDAWFEDWSEMLHTMQVCCARKKDGLGRLTRQGEPSARVARLRDLEALLAALLEIIRAEITREVVGYILSDAQERHGGRELIALTGQEMRLANRHYGRGGAQRQAGSAPPAPEEEIADADTGFEVAKTAKDSIEKLFSWLPRHKALLHGLNELLSLGKLV